MTPTLLSVQLYTVRAALADDLPGTLARLAETGLRNVEPYAFVDFGERLRKGLADAGLSAPSAHQHFVGESESRLGEVFEQAAAAGIATVIDPHVPAERWSQARDIAETADLLGAAAAVAAEHGVRVGYHNHAHEMGLLADGRTALEVLAAALTGPVVLELDTYWAAVGGQDPVALLHRLGDRVGLLHLKDGPGTHEDADQVALGQGTMPVPDIVRAAPHALRVIELDDSRGDLMTAVADSVAYLTAQGLA